jgi:hypothetical protein
MSAYYDEHGTLTVIKREVSSMKYTRNYGVTPRVAKPVDPFVPFHMAIDGMGYEDPITGDIRVKTGANYIRFLNDGSVGGGDIAACVPSAWPTSTRASWGVEVDISLKVWRKQ